MKVTVTATFKTVGLLFGELIVGQMWPSPPVGQSATEPKMTNHECLMTKELRNTNHEKYVREPFCCRHLSVRTSFDIRDSDVVIISVFRSNPRIDRKSTRHHAGRARLPDGIAR